MSEYHFPGIFWPNEDLKPLAARTMVSTVEIVDEPSPDHKQFYYDQAIVPGRPRSLTNEELTGIVAPENARDPIKLIKISKELGRIAWETELDLAFGQARPIIPGITGMLYARRLDLPGEFSATKVQRELDGRLQTFMLGMHFDHWRKSVDRSQQLAVINFGPGPRWHLLAPEYNFDAVGVPIETYQDDDALAYVQADLADKSQPPKQCYWVRLDPPDEHGRLSVLVHSPVAGVLHDGIVVGSEPSRFGAVRIIETDERLLSELAAHNAQELSDRS